MCYRTETYTVCKRVRASLRPDILQAWAVKALRTSIHPHPTPPVLPRQFNKNKNTISLAQGEQKQKEQKVGKRKLMNRTVSDCPRSIQFRLNANSLKPTKRNT